MGRPASYTSTSTEQQRSRQPQMRRGQDRLTPEPLIRTKLYAPTPTIDHVSRAHLLEQMNHALKSPLTLVLAPAGYGKSTLASDWLTTQPQRYAWLYLDASESEIRQFLVGFLAAIESAVPDACTATRELLDAPELPPIATLSAYLINDIDHLKPIVVVLDDYHRLRDAAQIHELIGNLIARAPPNLHLVILTRQEPPLPLARLRASGLLFELRLEDLSFTRAEVAIFLSGAGLEVDQEQIESVVRVTEGWPAGLRLLLQALRYEADPRTFLAKLEGSLPDMRAYLVSEVLAGQPAEVRECLLCASVVDRFCPALIDALRTDDTGAVSRLHGRDFIDYVMSQSLFTIPLDSSNEWFRYHHLFQELLQDQLAQHRSGQEIAALHMRASDWLERHGFVEEAITHALAASRPATAAEILERNYRAEFTRDRWWVVEAWLDLIPAAIKRQRLQLLLAQAWVIYFHFRYDVLTLIVPLIEAKIDEEQADELARAEADTLAGIVAYWSGASEECERRCERAIAQLSTRPLTAGQAQVFLALARQMNGHARLGIESLQAERRTEHSGNDQYQSRILASIGFIHLLSGNAPALGDIGLQIAHVTMRNRSAYAKAWGAYLQGRASLFGGECEEARAYFSVAVEERHRFERRAAADTLAGLAISLQVQGRADEAANVAADLAAFAEEKGDTECVTVAKSCAARIAILQHDRDRVVDWARSFNDDQEPLMFLIWFEVPTVTKIRAQIFEASRASVAAALRTLEVLLPKVRAEHKTAHEVDLLTLAAAAYEQQGRRTEAESMLASALALAEASNLLMPFLELLEALGGVLEALATRGERASFVERILSANTAIRSPRTRGPARLPTEAVPPAQPASPIELTNRELDVLELAAQRLRNKEIADRLHISVHTVKDHLKRIYSKVDAANRRDAVSKAIASGILSPQR